MDRTTQPRGAMVPPPGCLALYQPPPDQADEEEEDFEVLVNIREPGWFRLRMWTEGDFAVMGADEFPETWWRKGSVYYTFDPIPSPQ